MSENPPKGRLDSQAAVAAHLERLLALDPRLSEVYAAAGEFQPRSAPPGFPGLAKIICGQQVSVASASAIWRRLELLPDALTPEGFLARGETGLMGVGLSRSKFRTISGIAAVILSGELDLKAVEGLPAEDAVAALVKHKGIGPWTAEIYLMFCAGHPDIFPAGDLALQKGVAEALGQGDRLAIKDLIKIAEAWSPHRATAALLFWRYYAAKRDREGLSI
ncbi:MAG TPA: DNA-3-methyladenine glycosylase [Devosiaceae bacterium]|jgi:DNA-3-methyladenine glycosylase II